MSGNQRNSILVVDDEISMRDFLEILLTKEGYSITCAGSGEEACDIMGKSTFDLVITDIRMKGVDGIGVLKKAKELNPEVSVIIISAYANAETAVEAMKGGAYDYIPKPFNISDFKEIVRDVLQKKTEPGIRQHEKEKGTGIHFDCLIGESPQMKGVYDLIKRVSDSKANVLISGESGTGKELVARAIHQSSHWRDKPFVVINCGGIPETLIESELFGYKKGAFTGANTDKAGLLEAAHGGTVFFDEIGELSPAIQVKLLRVIQEKTFTRIGETEERRIDVRFISATNKNLEKEVMEARFREDLFFRLNVIEIPVPPLRDRKGDLPILAQYFLKKYSREMGKELKKISAYAMDILSQYPFPGNVRELENIIERSVALETSNIVLPQSLTLSSFKNVTVTKNRRSTDLAPEGIQLDKVMADMERDYIVKALEMAQGSRQKAADLLGISLRSLRYRMQKSGLQPDN